jgi:hypothetical protein
MPIMTQAATKPALPSLPRADGTDLPRMQLELALELADAGECSLAEKVAQAANAAGADLLFTLPAPNGMGMSALLRLNDDGDNRFLEIRTAETGLSISEGEEIDGNLLSLARASVEVLQRIGADPMIRAPLAAAS